MDLYINNIMNISKDKKEISNIFFCIFYFVPDILYFIQYFVL